MRIAYDRDGAAFTFSQDLKIVLAQRIHIKWSLRQRSFNCRGQYNSISDPNGIGVESTSRDGNYTSASFWVRVPHFRNVYAVLKYIHFSNQYYRYIIICRKHKHSLAVYEVCSISFAFFFLITSRRLSPVIFFSKLTVSISVVFFQRISFIKLFISV